MNTNHDNMPTKVSGLETDTPETDAACHETYAQGVAHIPLVGFMEKLERERNEAHIQWQTACQMAADAARDRDEARAIIEEMEIRHAAVMLNTQTVVDNTNDIIAAIRNVRDVKGRHHTQQAMENLFAILSAWEEKQP